MDGLKPFARRLKRLLLRPVRLGGSAPPLPVTGATGESRPLSNAGWCACCRSETQFEETGVWLRDQYLCVRCQSIPRFRAINLTLDRYFPGWEQLSIHESSPGTDFIRRYCQHYSWSFYFEGRPLGSDVNGSRCENLERLTFADNTFDLFVTQDVFEHVFEPGKAIAEIMRVLKPGGAHVWTAPKHKGLRQTARRAKLENGSIVHLQDEQYHGNPIGDGRSLVTWDYGDDFEACLWAWCGYPTVTYVTRDRSLGLDGEYLEVFVTRKVALPPALQAER